MLPLKPSNSPSNYSPFLIRMAKEARVTQILIRSHLLASVATIFSCHRFWMKVQWFGLWHRWIDLWCSSHAFLACYTSAQLSPWDDQGDRVLVWVLGRMWPWTPQKWQTGTNLGTSVFLTANLFSDFGFCLNKEQFGLIWPTTPQRWDRKSVV